MDHFIRILVVDEDASTRKLLTAALSTEKDLQIVTAASVDETFERLASGTPIDLVISDISSPRLCEIDLIGRIRALRGHIPFLVLSAMQTDESVARALESGADDYLQKPVDLRELRRAVSVLLSRSGKGAGEARSDSRVVKAPPAPSVRSLGDGTFVELTAPTDPVQAERFQRFAERLLSASLNDKDRHNLHLALEEILRNAIEWGNQNDHRKQLRLSYCLLPDRVTFRIEDEGKGFDHASLKDPSLDPAKHIMERRASGKRMGGWGVFLTRKVMDEVSYNDKGKVVFLTKYIKRVVPPPPPEPAADSSSQRPGVKGAVRRRRATTATAQAVRKKGRLRRV